MKTGVMKVWMVWLSMLGVLSACQETKIVGDQEGTVVTVSAKVVNADPSKPIYFYESVSRELIDSVFTNDAGEFSIQVRVASPSFYGLNVYNLQNEIFILDKESIQIELEGKEQGSFTVKGSKDNDLLQDFLVMKRELDEKSLSWQERAYANPTTEELNKLIDEQKAYAATYTQKVKTLIQEMKGSIAAIEAARVLDTDTEADFLESLADDLVKKYPDSKLCNDFKESVYSMTSIAVGRMAPDFELTTLKGETLKLSDYRGKYVLVDFWASWCGPCRRENPNVIKMYQKYGGKNFEILGVSTDQSEVQWRKAIRDDELPWAQVRDTEFEASTKYNVATIPFTVLVDREGQIIAKNLRGLLLEKKLQELFM